MKQYYRFFLAFMFIVITHAIQAQVASGVFNKYGLVVEIVNPCQVRVDSVQYYSEGDEVLFIQMKGGTIDTSNTSAYGGITSYGSAGSYELSKVAQIHGDTLYLEYQLVRSYDVNKPVQVITSGDYSTITVSGLVEAMPWDGERGGVVFLSAPDSIVFNGSINASGQGYRGGDPSTPSVNCGFLSYKTSNSSNGGVKGESFIPYTNERYGRGALAIGAGGGNNHNTGGGGGANYGRGGIGGLEYSNGTGACTPPLATGGIGGKFVPYSPKY